MPTGMSFEYEYPEANGNREHALPSAVKMCGELYSYEYDHNGNITKIEKTPRPDSTESIRKDTFQYDERNQLIRENSQNQDKTIVYAYDLGGNLISVKEYAYTEGELPETTLRTETGTYNTVWKDQLLNWNGTEMTYDAVGNMLTKGDTAYTWSQGRKLSVVNNGKNIQYHYDHTGARVKKTVDGVLTEYHMAGEILASETTNGKTIWYTYDTRANLVSMAVDGKYYFYVRNLQNDIIALVDEDGKTVVNYSYDSWGRILDITGELKDTIGIQNPFRYRGYYYDNETGMYYLKNRYYDPELRRFISADEKSVLEVQSNLYDKNLYIYCDNNPIMRKDADGELWIAAVVVGVATQYTGDVIENLLDGKKGVDIFIPTSSIGEYIAAGVTALIPGTGIAGNLVRNITAEAIVSGERYVMGKDNNLKSSVINVTCGTAIDTGVEAVASRATKYVDRKISKTYSQKAKTMRKKNPNVSTTKIRKSAQRSVRWGNRLAKGINFVINSIRSALPW